MNEFFASMSFFGLFLSLLTYMIGLAIKKRFKSGLANPLLIAIILTIAFLLIGKIDYETYNAGAKYLTYLLTPSTICLALPLYQQIEKLKKNFAAIFAGILSGTLASMTSVLLLSKLLGFTKTEYITFLPKSITSAIGLGVSEELGGYPSITVAVIILTGVLGNILCEPILKLTGIRHSIAKGVGIGTSSHAVGTAKAIEIGEVEGAISSLSIVVAGLLTVLLANLFVSFY